MKRLLIAVLLLTLFAGVTFAGELRTLPQYLILSDPTTNESEFMTMTHHYHTTDPYAVISVHVLDSQGVRDLVTVEIRNIPDDPESITANCLGENDPWALCTGAGTCADDCDESDPAYSDFIDGYGGTMKSRGDSKVWQKLQELYETQATP